MLFTFVPVCNVNAKSDAWCKVMATDDAISEKLISVNFFAIFLILTDQSGAQHV